MGFFSLDVKSELFVVGWERYSEGRGWSWRGGGDLTLIRVELRGSVRCGATWKKKRVNELTLGAGEQANEAKGVNHPFLKSSSLPVVEAITGCIGIATL